MKAAEADNRKCSGSYPPTNDASPQVRGGVEAQVRLPMRRRRPFSPSSTTICVTSKSFLGILASYSHSARLLLGDFKMCVGCFNQLLLRDEFHSGGLAHVIRKAAGRPTRRTFMAYSVAAASALSGAGGGPAVAAGEGADLILRGGTIRPLAGGPVASALAIKGGKVLAVGDEGALIGLKTSETTIVDLAGRTALPESRPPLPHAARFAHLRTARRRRLRKISDTRKPYRASQAGGGRDATRAMDRRLELRQSAAGRRSHARRTGCDFNRPSDFRLVHQRA